VSGNPLTTRDEDWKDVLRSYKLVVDEKPQAQAANDSSRIRDDADMDQRKLRVFKRSDLEERDREYTYQRTLQNLISMVQITNSAIEAELHPPKRDNLRWGNCSAEDVEDLEETSWRFGTSFAEVGRSHLSNFHVMLSPRNPNSRRLLMNSTDFHGDLGLLDDRFEMASD